MRENYGLLIVFMPWNDLPAFVVPSANLNIFKKGLDTVNLLK